MDRSGIEYFYFLTCIYQQGRITAELVAEDMEDFIRPLEL